MYWGKAPGSYSVYFVPDYKDASLLFIEDGLYVPESIAYKFMLMFDGVTDENLQRCVDHAINKLNKFIDNFQV